MRADEPIICWVDVILSATDKDILHYINQLRVDRLMRGKRIAELEAHIATTEFLSGIIDDRQYIEKRKKHIRIIKSLEAMAKRIKEGM